MIVATDPESTNMVGAQLSVLPLVMVFGGYCCFIPCVMVFLCKGLS